MQLFLCYSEPSVFDFNCVNLKKNYISSRMPSSGSRRFLIEGILGIDIVPVHKRAMTINSITPPSAAPTIKPTLGLSSLAAAVACVGGEGAGPGPGPGPGGDGEVGGVGELKAIGCAPIELRRTMSSDDLICLE